MSQDEQRGQQVSESSDPPEVPAHISGPLPSLAERERCPYSCGIAEVHARDGQVFFPPLIEVIDCGLIAGHPGKCVP